MPGEFSDGLGASGNAGPRISGLNGSLSFGFVRYDTRPLQRDLPAYMRTDSWYDTVNVPIKSGFRARPESKLEFSPNGAHTSKCQIYDKRKRRPPRLASAPEVPSSFVRYSENQPDGCIPSKVGDPVNKFTELDPHRTWSAGFGTPPTPLKRFAVTQPYSVRMRSTNAWDSSSNALMFRDPLKSRSQRFATFDSSRLRHLGSSTPKVFDKKYSKI
jgi:hypothetical protein